MDSIARKRLAYLLVLAASPALAQDAPVRVYQPEPQPQPSQPSPHDDDPLPAAGNATNARVEAIEARLRTVEDELDAQKDDNKYLEEKIESMVPLKITGYLDLGAFATTGNGAGTRTDVGHMLFPEYSYVPETWVFYGDPL